MNTYLLSIYQPDGDPPPLELLAPVMRDLDALNREIKAAGARVFAAALDPPGAATVLRVRDGEVLVTDGSYVEGKEHIGGFTIVRAPDLAAAREWGRRLARVLAPLPIEVRQLSGDTEH